MTPAAWNWLLTIAGTIASVIGVVFSGMAWIQAAKAKDAAREATDAVRKRNTAQQVLKLAGDAKEFLSSVQQDRAENAISAANSLLHSLSLLRTQSIADFPDTDTLKACLAMLMSVAIRLNVDGVPEDSSKREELLVLCHGIHRSVCDLAGRMERLSEGALP
jgi:hypothetical protein